MNSDTWLDQDPNCPVAANLAHSPHNNAANTCDMCTVWSMPLCMTHRYSRVDHILKFAYHGGQHATGLSGQATSNFSRTG